MALVEELLHVRLSSHGAYQYGNPFHARYGRVSMLASTADIEIVILAFRSSMFDTFLM